MRKTIVTCTDGTKVIIDWKGTKEEIVKFIFMYYGKTAEKVRLSL